jgi:tRNA (guanine-N7-)-methyltransferase
VAKRDLANVRLVRADARQWLRDQVPADSVAAVHVYFPDPWWKKRHKKRRVFTAEFAAECERALAPGGALHLATDVEEYFGVMTELVTSATRLRPVPPAVLFVGPDGRPRETNFERKAREQGRAVWRASYRRPGPPESPS